MLGDLLNNLEALPQELLAKPLQWVIASFVLVVVTLYLRAVSDARIKQLNPKKLSDIFGSQSKEDFNKNADKMLKEWFKANPDKPTSLYTDMGPMTVLPASLANEIRNDSRLDFENVTRKMFHAGLPGFEPFANGTDSQIVTRVVTKDLTKHLTQVTAPLSEETSLVLEELVTNNPEWHKVELRDTILRVVARISSRVFLGDELCRNEEWLRVTREYTVTAFIAGQKLRMYPKFLRPIMCRILPICKEAQAQVAKSREVIAPVLKRRQELKRKAAEAGEVYQGSNDAIDWFEDVSQGQYYDPAMIQLILSFAAIHTTTDLLSQTLIDIAAHPEIKTALREEIVSVLKEDGWAKTAFYKMKLLDSTIKESQRLKPISMVSMTRIAKERIKLSEGTVIQKGDLVCVTSNKMWDSAIYDKVEEWDPYRFLNMREQPDKQHLAQLVTTGPNHLAFGHGQHACPGRFFAANEVKIALITILLKYDIDLIDGYTPRSFTYGFTMNPDPGVQVQFRRRQEEVQI